MRILIALVALALSGVLPASAQDRSDCPIATDAQSGIRLTRQNPLFDMVLRKKGAIITEDRKMVQNGKTRRVKTTYLHGLVPLVRKEGGQSITLKPANANTGFVTNGRLRNWSSPVEIRGGSRFYGNGKVTVRRVGKASWSGSGCTYKVQRVIVSTHIDGRPTSHFEYFFAPSLGITLGGYKLASDGRTRIQSVLPERISAE